MVWNKRSGPRAVACTAALLMTLSLQALASGAYAQEQNPPVAQAPASAQVPQPVQGGVNWPGAGYGAASVASNVLYIPAKLVYGVLGGLVGGATYLLTAGNSQTADTVWRSSLGGDWVVTPAMIQGKQPLHFSGPTETAPEKSKVEPIAQGPAAPSPATSSAGAAASVPSTAQPIDAGAAPAASTGARGSVPATLPDTSIE
jgi:hypothetical protein